MTTESRFKPWMLVSAAWVLPAIFASVNRVAQTHLSGWDPATLRELIWQSGDWLLYAFLTPAVFAVSSRWPLVRPFLTRRVILHLVFSLLFCVAWATFGKLFQGALYFLFDRRPLSTTADRTVLQGGIRRMVKLDLHDAAFRDRRVFMRRRS